LIDAGSLVSFVVSGFFSLGLEVLSSRFPILGFPGVALEVEGLIGLRTKRFVLITRRSYLNQRLYRGLIVAALAIVPSGCGEPTLPDTPPGASRSMMENPLGAAEAAKKARPQSAKLKTALENAAKADPRGK